LINKDEKKNFCFLFNFYNENFKLVDTILSFLSIRMTLEFVINDNTACLGVPCQFY